MGTTSSGADDLAAIGENFLAHYGVKGMKWGKRTATATDGSGRTAPLTIKQRRALATMPKGEKLAKEQETISTQVLGQRVQATGGKYREAHPDAIRAAQAKQIAKASTTDALSTKDFQDLVQRMNLEQQYSKLVTPDKNSREAKLKKAGIDFITSTAIERVEAPITAMAKAQFGEMGAAAVKTAFTQMKPKKNNG